MSAPSRTVLFRLRSAIVALAVLSLALFTPCAIAQSCGNWIPGPSSPDLPLNVGVNSMAVINAELYVFGTDFTTPTTPRIYVLRGGLWQTLPWDDAAFGQIQIFNGDNGVPAALSTRTISGNATTRTLEYAIRTFNGTSWTLAASMQQTIPLTGAALSFGDITVYNGAWYLCTIGSANASVYRSSGATLALLATTDTTTCTQIIFSCVYLDPRSILTMQVGVDGLYLGGRFESITPVGGSAVTAKNLVRFNGTQFLPLASQPNSKVRGMLLDSTIQFNNQGLVIWGDFTQVGTLAASSIARWNSVTSTWNTFGSGLNGPPAALVQVQGVTLNSINYVAVYAFPAGLADAWGCAKWTGSAWENFGGVDAAALNNPGSFTAGVNFSGVIVGGSGLSVNNVPRYGVSRWSGASWDFVAQQQGTDGISRAIATHNSSIYVGGDFTRIDSVSAAHVARYNPATDTYEPLGAGSGGVNGPVSALTSFGGELIAGGTFTTASGNAALNVAAFNGTQWRALGAGLNGAVRGFATWNGSLVAVGSFRASGATTTGSAASWNGTAWVAVDATFTAADLYAASTLGSTLYVGGPTGFRRFNGAAFEIAGNNVAGTVYALFPLFGSMYVGGDFPTVSSPTLPYKRIARWSGTAWAAVGPNANFDFATGSIRAIFGNADEIFAGGDFQVTISTSATATNIARFDGTQWRRLDAESPSARPLAGTILGPRVWVAGEFTTVGPSSGPTESYGVGQWSKLPVFITNPAPQSVCQTDGSGQAVFTVQPMGTPAPALRWHKNGSPITDNLRISGTGTATLTINGVISTDAATYSCLATDTCAGTAFSAGALLTFGCCTADYDNSGTLTVNDIFAFLNGWFAGNPAADFNHANGITVQDIFDFLSAWFAGC